MKNLRMIGWCFIGAIALGALSAAGDDLGTIFGVVRDIAGKPIEGAKVTLLLRNQVPVAENTNREQSAGDSKTSAETVTNVEGRYRFAGLLPGEYQLRAEMGELTATTPKAIVLSASSPSVTADLTLTRSSLQKALFTTPSQPLKFEAAGVRGLIDPGGYSAPTNAAAASGLIAGIADIKRSGNGLRALAANDWPCSREPELRKTVEQTPDSADANRRLGEFYLGHDQSGNALPFLQRTHTIDPANDAVSEELAVAGMKSGQFTSARELLSALAARQSTAPIRMLLARADEGLGLFTQASEEYKVAATAEPSEENLFGVGYELILAGSVTEAENAFRAGVRLFPHSITLLIGVGVAEFLQGHSADSLVWFLQATDLNPRDPRPYSFLSSASAVSQTGSDRVLSKFKRFYDLAPDNPQASYFYALSLSEARNESPSTPDSVSIESLFKHAIQLEPNFARAHYQLGSLYADRGDYNDAVREYETTVRLAPDFKDAHYRLARAYRHAGHPELANHEIELFKQIRDSQDRGISIDQFVSVLDRPAVDRAGQDTPGAQCPPSP